MTKAKPKAPPAASAEATGTEPAKRVTPALWMPVAPTIAWLAFGSAETDWDAGIYFGASIWYAADPDRVLDELRGVERYGYPFEISSPDGGLHLRGILLAEARRVDPIPAGGKQVSSEAIKAAAGTFAATLASNLSSVREKHEAIWNAAETLRQHLASGRLIAYGWPGLGPSYNEDTREPFSPREPIPCEMFARPVTITQDGLLGFARGDGHWGEDFETLWSGLLFESQKVLTLNACGADEQPSAPATPLAPAATPDRGGREARHDWASFNNECRLHRRKLPESLPGLELKRQLTSHMQWWAARNMADPPPTKRTIRGKVTQFLQAEANGSAQLSRI